MGFRLCGGSLSARSSMITMVMVSPTTKSTLPRTKPSDREAVMSGHVRVPIRPRPLGPGPAMPRPRTDTIKFLTLDETARLFSAITDRRDRALFLTAYRHGLRASEIGLLQVTDLDFRKLRIMLHRLKGSHSGEHPLQPDEAKAIKAHLRTRPKESPILFASRLGDPIGRGALHLAMKKYGVG